MLVTQPQLQRRHSATWVVLISVAMVSAAQAQQSPYPAPAQPYPAPAYPVQAPAYPNTYPQQPAYPGTATPYPAPTSAYPGQLSQGCAPASPLAPQSHFFRDLFAQTIAVVLNTSAVGLLASIAGRILGWFSRKGSDATSSPYAAQYPQYGNPGYPSQATGYPNSGYAPTATAGCPAAAPAFAAAGTYPGQTAGYQTTPGYPSAATYPTSPSYSATPGYPTASSYTTTPGYPTAPSAGLTPTTTQAPPYPTATLPVGTAAASAFPAPAQSASAYPATAPTQVYDARTGQLVPADANPYATRGLASESTLYAGIAYEVHTLAADGTYATPVNTATYDFHTGDKFMVYYRPSLPGHMEIYNINASGKQTLIDSSIMPAGEMVALGPYQFTNDSGEESLRLVLSPCSTPQLLTATRDIVKVDAPTGSSSGIAAQLGSCGTPGARGLDVQTRDIEKVGVEGTTSFALDPVSSAELKSGQVTPRQMTIVFHHR